MLTNEEEKFLAYWQKNRERERTFKRQISLGLPIGLLIGVGIILNFVSGWYSRATMVANGQSTPMVLVVAVIIIALFCSVFYKKHQWDMNEQRFLELTFKKQREEFITNMQQDTLENSQLDS